MNTNKYATIFLILLLSASALLTILPSASAHTPAWNVPTYAYLAISPNPVGVGQPVFLVMWIDKPPPTAAGSAGDRWQGFRITITLPDGSKKNLGPFTSDATSSTFTSYTPIATGEYSFFFSFPGQTAALNNPLNGQPGSASQSVGDWYMPSNATATLTVQADKVTSPPEYPLPTTYWTRPVEGQNTAWVSMLSNYLAPMGAAYSYGAERLQPYGDAPDSAHVMWANPISFGGVVGGNIQSIQGATYYSGLSYETKFNNPLILYGRLYYTLPLSNNGAGTPPQFACYDLRTGELIWVQNFTYTPTFAQIYDYESMNQHGVIANGYLWGTSSTNWFAYDALTGALLFNLTNVPSGTNYYGPSGEILRYNLNIGAKWLALWNNTCEQQGLHGANGTSSAAYQWRPVGKSVNMEKAYSWNVTIPTITSPYGATATTRYIIQDDMLLGSFGNPGTGCTVFAISLKPNSRGALLWKQDYAPPEGNLTRSFEAVDPVNRVFTMSDKETMQWSGFSMDTGDNLWGPLGQTRAFNFYPTVGSGGVSQVGFCAYGKLYVDGYGGELFCYDTKTGDLLWKYNNTYSGIDTPWGNYPLFTGAIADGKIYCFNNEHSPNVPQYKGEKARCIDAYSGEELWTLQSWAGVGGFADLAWPVADGYLCYLNTYDMQVYCIGKGPSATTVSATPGVGNIVTIQGSVTDISAGAKRKIATGEFTSVPAMSDKDQGDWMAYIYMQKPMPTNATGVDVSLFITDSAGALVDTVTCTSDASGQYAVSWVPPAAGLYTVTAAFDQTKSYYASTAETHFSVAVAAPTAAPTTAAPTTAAPTTAAPTTAAPSTTAPEPGNPTMTYVYVSVAAVVVIVVIAAIAMFLRRRK